MRAYLLQTAEKGYAWLRLRATGRAGHGSVPNDENAIVRLSQAVAAIDAHEFPREYVASVRSLFDAVTAITGEEWTEEDPEAFLPLLGGARQFVSGTLADSANVTAFHAGYKGNVIPQTAEAELDCRLLPGHQEDLLALIDELSGEHVAVIIDKIGISLDAPGDTPFVEAMHRSIRAEDPGAGLLPYCLSAGTDNKPLAQIGIGGYGFAPLKLPADLDFAPLFHGIDERVPVDAIRFGARVLLRLVGDCCGGGRLTETLAGPVILCQTRRMAAYDAFPLHIFDALGTEPLVLEERIGGSVMVVERHPQNGPITLLSASASRISTDSGEKVELAVEVPGGQQGAALVAMRIVCDDIATRRRVPPVGAPWRTGSERFSVAARRQCNAED
ncbi:peptidase dimerization domain-containing protein [Brachybacterium squillarum]|uniref:peptidase dimerization domain-containing protein n=1 Tax=Brachybacterium squillarum TaxID=661979 RepID=UPI0029C9CB92|nr:peptidase dimerization domain-containing protein [Brachybacterium squillarum]